MKTPTFKRPTKIEVFVIALILAVIYVMVIPAILSSRSRGKRVACTGNIKKLNAALVAYANDHGAYPQKLSDLYPKYVSDLNVFVCPGKPKKITQPEEIDSKGGYVLLLPGGSPSTDVSDDRRLLCDRRFNHRDGWGEPWGGNVLYCDGHQLMNMDKAVTNRSAGSLPTFDFPD